jgi:hypothetical protein
MDTLLIAVTAVALAMTAVMAVIVVTVLRQERARSEARVAALSEMAGDARDDRQELPRHELHQEQVTRREASAPRFTAAPAPVHAVSDRHIQLFSDRAAVDDVDDLEIRPDVSGVSTLFSEPEQPSPWGRRLVVIGCLAALVVAIGMTMVFSRSKSPSVAAGATATQASTATDVSPLELLSLRYRQESDRMVITGLVQNPRGAAPISRVVATAFVFGKDGTFLSSGRAPLDFVTLTPGEESPFVVNVPVTGQVTRYRVGFRTEDGRVLPHVDKRAPEALAQK